MQDFLTFQTFITPTLLLISYYIGAVFIPIASYTIARWIKSTYFSTVSTQLSEVIITKTTFQQRFAFILVLIVCFVCMELFWRVMFEFLIAYFDMHDALMKLPKEYNVSPTF